MACSPATSSPRESSRFRLQGRIPPWLHITYASAYAHTDVKARWFSKESFEEICQHHPQVGLTISGALGQNLTTKLREFVDRIAGYIFGVWLKFVGADFTLPFSAQKSLPLAERQSGTRKGVVAGAAGENVGNHPSHR